MTAIGILLGFQAFAIVLQAYLLHKHDVLLGQLKVHFIPIPFSVVHERAPELPIEVKFDEEPTEPGTPSGGLQ